MKYLILCLIRFYRGAISPWLRPACRFVPSCSEYWQEAISEFGVARGVGLGIWRLLRCQPLCRSGLDPIPCRTAYCVQSTAKIKKPQYAVRSTQYN